MNYAVGWNQTFNKRVENKYTLTRKKEKKASWMILPSCFLFVVLLLQLHVRLTMVSRSYEVEKLRESIVQKQDRIRELELSLEEVSEPDFIMQMAKSKLNMAITPPQRIRKITIN